MSNQQSMNQKEGGKPAIVKKIGNTTYKVTIHFSNTSQETVGYKVKCLVLDDYRKMPENAGHQGIGAPATRAGIIEKLVKKGFLTREGSGKTKSLIPAQKGWKLIAVMPEAIQSPDRTADWEPEATSNRAG